MIKYESKMNESLLNPISVTRGDPMLDFEIDCFGKIWASSNNGLYVLDSELVFIKEITMRKKLNTDMTRMNKVKFQKKKVKNLAVSLNGQFIYWINFDLNLHKINCKNFEIESSYNSKIVGHEINQFRILSKKYILTLNFDRNFFVLVDLTKGAKCCSLNLERGTKKGKVIDFDCSPKGNRLLIIRK